jgi:D-beta-D-heptose 7-phosphate kinase/D-beta-D-heptose 1-phosphate adenosyltransferase
MGRVKEFHRRLQFGGAGNCGSSRLGGAANVVNNIRSLGAQVTACGVIGRDLAGKRLLHDLRRAGASTAGIFADKQVQTIQKSRIIARPRHQQIVRLDRENDNPIGESTLKRLCAFVLARAKACDAVIISDYGKGVVHANLLRSIAKLVKKQDHRNRPKRKIQVLASALITPNKDEASDASGWVHDEKSPCRRQAGHLAAEVLMRSGWNEPFDALRG